MASAKIIELDETNTCKICDNALARYSCPRCNILYCSLNCYQANKHIECSESFYKDNIMTEFNLNNKDDESKAKMLEILKRTHENNRLPFTTSEGEECETEEEYPGFNFDSFCENISGGLDSDDEDYIDIAERLAGVNLDDADVVWDKLTEDEKQEFVAFLKSEDVAKLIPSWQPWWLYYKDSKIEEVAGENGYKKNCPSIVDIKDFSQITTKSPAGSVRFNLINIITSYAFTTRYFNGEHFDFAQEAVSCIISLSLTLKIAQNFEDIETAVKSVELECINSDWIISDKENIQTMRDDVDKILRGPKECENNFYIICAMSDLHRLLNKALKPVEGNSGIFSKKFPNEHFPTVKLESVDQIKSYVKKIDYYLSYAKDCYSSS